MTPPNWHPAFQGVGDSQTKNRLPSVLALLCLRPPTKAQGWQSRKNIQKSSSLSGGSWVVFLEMEAWDGVLSQWYQASQGRGDPCLTSRFWKRVISTTFSAAAMLEVWGQRGATKPSGMLSSVDPQSKQSSWAWLSWQLPHCFPLRNSLPPSSYPAEAFTSKVRAISASRNQHLQAAKLHRTVFNRNFIDIEDPHRTLMNIWTLVWHLSA